MKNNKVIYPDYDKNIINITASILHYYGCDHDYSALPELSSEYLDKFENIVFFVVDGLGTNVLEHHLPTTSLLRRNTVATLTSVFPPTTAAAISSFLSGTSPLEHGIIGWSLYFKEYFKLIDFLPLSDSTTGEPLPEFYDEVHDKMHFESIFKKIKVLKPEIEQYYVTPDYLVNSSYTKMASDSAEMYAYEELTKAIDYVQKTIKSNSNKKLFYCYTSEPDKSMHRDGTYTEGITAIMESVEKEIAKLKEQVKDTKTLIIVTADHGMIDVADPIYLDKEKQLEECLILPPFPEPRFTSCFVHKDKETQFLEYMEQHKDDFIVLSKEEFLEKGLLGRGTPHPRVLEMLGDYLVLAIGNRSIQTRYPQTDRSFEFLAMHAGITAQEMLVPLILLD